MICHHSNIHFSTSMYLKSFPPFPPCPLQKTQTNLTKPAKGEIRLHGSESKSEAEVFFCPTPLVQMGETWKNCISIWSNYNDLTPNGGLLSREIPSYFRETVWLAKY